MLVPAQATQSSVSTMSSVVEQGSPSMHCLETRPTGARDAIARENSTKQDNRYAAITALRRTSEGMPGGDIVSRLGLGEVPDLPRRTRQKIVDCLMAVCHRHGDEGVPTEQRFDDDARYSLQKIHITAAVIDHAHIIKVVANRAAGQDTNIGS
jgi:hypothetical protein